MNSKNRAEWLRAPLCLEKGKTGRKSLAECDEMRSSDVTNLAPTTQVTCQDVLLSSGGTLIPNDGVGSTAVKANCNYGVDSLPAGYELLGRHYQSHAQYMAAAADAQQSALVLFEEFLLDNIDHLALAGRLGDNNGGAYVEIIRRTFGKCLTPAGHSVGTRSKRRVPGWLRKKVFERDAYRCVYCSSHIDLQADHRHPESLGGETSIDNLQTTCGSCNRAKGAHPNWQPQSSLSEVLA